MCRLTTSDGKSILSAYSEQLLSNAGQRGCHHADRRKAINTEIGVIFPQRNVAIICASVKEVKKKNEAHINLFKLSISILIVLNVYFMPDTIKIPSKKWILCVCVKTMYLQEYCIFALLSIFII